MFQDFIFKIEKFILETREFASKEFDRLTYGFNRKQRFAIGFLLLNAISILFLGDCSDFYTSAGFIAIIYFLVSSRLTIKQYEKLLHEKETKLNSFMCNAEKKVQESMDNLKKDIVKLEKTIEALQCSFNNLDQKYLDAHETSLNNLKRQYQRISSSSEKLIEQKIDEIMTEFRRDLGKSQITKSPYLNKKDDENDT